MQRTPLADPKRASLPSSCNVCRSFVKLCEACGAARQPWRAFHAWRNTRRMPQGRHLLGSHAGAALVLCYRSTADHAAAEAALQDLQARGVAVDRYAFNAAIRVAADAGAADAALRLLGRLRELAAAERQRQQQRQQQQRWHEQWEQVQQQRQQPVEPGVVPSGSTTTSAGGNCTSNSSGSTSSSSTGGPDAPASSELRTDCRSYSAALAAVAAAGKYNRAAQLHRWMREDGVRPDAPLCTQLLACYAAGGQPQAVQQLFDEMAAGGSRGGAGEGLFATLHTSATSWRHLLVSRCPCVPCHARVGLLRCARTPGHAIAAARACRHRRSPPAPTPSLCVCVAGRDGLPLPNSSHWNTLLLAYAEGKDAAGAAAAYRRLLAAGRRPDAYSLVALARAAYLAEAGLAAVRAVRAEAARHRVPMSLQLGTSLLACLRHVRPARGDAAAALAALAVPARQQRAARQQQQPAGQQRQQQHPQRQQPAGQQQHHHHRQQQQGNAPGSSHATAPTPPPDDGCACLAEAASVFAALQDAAAPRGGVRLDVRAWNALMAVQLAAGDHAGVLRSFEALEGDAAGPLPDGATLDAVVAACAAAGWRQREAQFRGLRKSTRMLGGSQGQQRGAS